jgi:hypothetical protein
VTNTKLTFLDHTVFAWLLTNAPRDMPAELTARYPDREFRIAAPTVRYLFVQCAQGRDIAWLMDDLEDALRFFEVVWPTTFKTWRHEAVLTRLLSENQIDTVNHDRELAAIANDVDGITAEVLTMRAAELRKIPGLIAVPFDSADPLDDGGDDGPTPSGRPPTTGQSGAPSGQTLGDKPRLTIIDGGLPPRDVAA